MTETVASKGCRLLAERFTAAGYSVEFDEPPPGERGAMIVSKLPHIGPPPHDAVSYLPHRAPAITVKTEHGTLDVIGLYVPSRDATPAKIERKRRFLDACRAAIPPGTAPAARLILGDFNVLEPTHQPHYRFFQPFEYAFYTWLGEAGYRDAFRLLHPTADEYSWVGRTGDGYRYDHAFTSGTLGDQVAACSYVHEPRTDRLTDHSALSLQLAVTPVAPLLVSDPTTTPGPETDPLF
ncbi:endonuclease/exonuclease/phosphatase [Streptomyces gilvosporeus]|uniref:Endonuclease/exonuclease/phosphatase n=1 Tax=Streptomyces gilvosporeus TaxID=553510 RepID=A0A1V0U300_9ACTN|nr:endonuclease/exonuclease/phosphatase [Streptomyces gilvosporeus]